MLDGGQLSLDITVAPSFGGDSLDGLIVDNFAGGGGASTGAAAAMGREPDYAINHDAEALLMHAANHPTTKHLQEDVYRVDPAALCRGRRVALAWFSPDCTHHSKAKGGKPRSTKRRGLAWVAVRWAAAVKPTLIVLENVEEFRDWGPITRGTGQPCPRRKGATFRAFVRRLERLGYVVEHRLLRACDYGAPTMRRRMFLVARCDGQAIRWPTPTHGTTRRPHRAVAECIDWSVPHRSIFDRAKPLAEPTMARIAAGYAKFVVGRKPYIVDDKAWFLIQTGYGERKGQAPRVLDLERPLGTAVAGGVKHALVAVWMAKHFGGHSTPGCAVDRPLDTITTQDHHALVYAFLVRYHGNGSADDLRHPLGTVTTRDRFGLVMVHGQQYAPVDITMRMLEPRELFTAQGFPPDYVIDPVGPNGKPLSKTAQVRMCGNSVSPEPARALVEVNAYTAAARRAA